VAGVTRWPVRVCTVKSGQPLARFRSLYPYPVETGNVAACEMISKQGIRRYPEDERFYSTTFPQKRRSKKYAKKCKKRDSKSP